MLYFPQLETGAMVQYPLVKRRVHRTVGSTLADGRVLKLADAGGMRIVWELMFQALSNQERQALEDFVRTVEGRLGEFTLLDPTDNLLVWSEDLNAAAWTKGPLLNIADGMIENTGGAEQSLQQTISGPGWYCYCFSLYARCAVASTVKLYRSTGGETAERDYRLTGDWKRLVLSGRTDTVAESVTFGLRIPAAATVEVFGIQAEAQPAPSSYRKTTSRSGIYPNARFEDDSFAMVSEGPEQHSCRVRIGASVDS